MTDHSKAKQNEPANDRVSPEEIAKLLADETNPIGGIIKQLLADLRSGKPPGQVAVNARSLRARKADGPTVQSHKGICHHVRQWAEQHPDATMHDALAAFPQDNKITVRIQYSKARA